MQKWYALKGTTPTLGGNALFGPGVWPNATQPLDLNLVNFFSHAGSVIGPYLLDGPCRTLKFPGVLRTEVPALGSLTMAAPAGITNSSTITLDDGNGNVGVFHFRKSGGVVAIDVDITAATTAAEVATAFAAAVNTWTTGLGPSDGFTAVADGATVYLVQAHVSKNVNPTRSWLLITNGALGNIAIVAGVGSGATNVVGMRGGKDRKAGLPVFLANHQRLLPYGATFIPPIKPPIG